MRPTTLRRRLYWLFVEWFLLFLVVSSFVTFLSFARFRENALDERLLLARTVAHDLDSTTSSALQNLGRLVTQLPSLDAEVIGQLRSFRFQSPFREAIYVLNERGDKLVSDPPFAEPIETAGLPTHEVVTHLVSRAGERNRTTLAIVQPFRRGGRQYYLVSEMNPLGSLLSTFLQNLATEPHLHVVVVDDNGVVIAAPDQSQLFRVMPQAELIGERIRGHRPYVEEGAQCSVCGEEEEQEGFLTVMVPLRFAPWGVVVQQHERRAFASLYISQYGFLAVGALLLLMGFFLSRALMRSVVSPIQALSAQADLLRHGDLSQPITVKGDYEVELLATTMDAARRRLAASLDELRALNENLEEQVAWRTRVLRAQYENLRLLHHLAQVAAREREPEQLIPQLLRLIAQHYSFEAIGLVTTPSNEPAAAYAFPALAALPWLSEAAEPPGGWERRELVYQGRSQGRLFHPHAENPDGGFIEALQQQLAMSLHGAYLLTRTLDQDRQRQILVRRLLDASEEERKRIARELHDEISQLLTVIQLSLEDAAETTQMRRAKDLLGQTQKEIHRIIHDLRPSLLDDLGLAAAVEWYATNYLSPQGLQVNLEIEQDLAPLPAEVQIATFRIYQEIITNILRHSKAENVSVELYTNDEDLVLAVEDDGVGFVPEQKFEGAGVVGMRERAALVNGTITFDSTPGMGTHVRVKIPLRS